MGSVAASIFASLLILTGPGASASASGAEAPPPRVVLVRTAGDEVFTGRLRAELAVWSWDVEEIEAQSSAGDVALPSVAATNGARAAVRFQRRPAEAELWTDGLPAGATVRLGVNAVGAKIESVLAVVVAEQLRSRLTGTGLAMPASDALSRPARVAPPAPGPDLVAAPPGGRDVWLAATPGVGVGGFGPAPYLIASAGAALGRDWSVDLLAALPVVASTLTIAEGAAQMSPFVFGAGVGRVAFGPRWRLQLAGGGGIAWVIVHGQSNDPLMFESRRANLVLPLGWTRLTVTRQLTPRWRLRADALLAGTVRPAIIRVADHNAARWGQPVLMLSVGAELSVRPSRGP